MAATNIKRAMIDVQVKVDDAYISEVEADAREEIEQKIRDAIEEFGDVQSLKVRLTGWEPSDGR